MMGYIGKKGNLGKRRSLKGGIVRAKNTPSQLRNLGIREINPFRSTFRGA